MGISKIKAFASKHYIYIILIILLLVSFFFNATLMKEINEKYKFKNIAGTYLYGDSQLDDNAEYFTFMKDKKTYYRWKQFIMLEKGVYKKEGDYIFLLKSSESDDNENEENNYVVLSNKKLYFFNSNKDDISEYTKISHECLFINVKEYENNDEPRILDEDELAYFNGNLFFNGEVFNIRNQFLSSVYDKPEDINLFYSTIDSYVDEKITDTEIQAVMEQLEIEGSPDDLPCICNKISASTMDKVLKEYMGIGFEDTNKVGLENFVYLLKYDAYYHIHGDSNYENVINFSKGERDGNIVRLYYKDTFYNDGEKVLTLKIEDGNYKFVSNQKTKN